MSRGRKAGDRPVDVRLVNRTTGESIPCELAYKGINDEGQHVWAIMARFDPAHEKITVGVFPPRTTLTFPTDLESWLGDSEED